MSNDTTTPVASAGFAASTLDRLAALEQSAQDEAAGGGTVTSDAGTCTVTAVRSGKADDRCLEVAGGTTISSLMSQLGWSTDGCTFKKRTDQGPLIECNAQTVLDADADHFVVCSPRVVGG